MFVQSGKQQISLKRSCNSCFHSEVSKSANKSKTGNIYKFLEVVLSFFIFILSVNSEMRDFIVRGEEKKVKKCIEHSSAEMSRVKIMRQRGRTFLLCL